ncbi:unnamed protein product [Somion occarium]|uniref:J domain-containing protein n=1 Tax=Somion occarium TaxID=3059160 RepID=A0ABP1D1Z4_9APHY
MANYNYDEAGNMAAYFLLTFLLIVLVPFSLPSASSKQPIVSECDCHECVDHRARLRKTEGVNIRKYFILAIGWALFAWVAYKVSTAEIENKVYNPFEILDIKNGASIKEIKSHYKKLSKALHPDKVKLNVNLTIEAVEARFVEITKAYKSLTDETIRQNWERYGHPDGRQEVSMGIALPKWIVEGKNNIWVLGVYALIFGGALPGLVGKWWFGNRKKTKDGVDARSAATFFKAISEESGMDDIVSSLGKSFEWETTPASGHISELSELETSVKKRLGHKWDELTKAAEALPENSDIRRKGLALLYAHFLRIPVPPSLQKDQIKLLLQTPVLLNSLLSISTTRNWLAPTLSAIRFQSYLAQAILPGQDTLKYAQLPGLNEAEAEELAKKSEIVSDVLRSLEESGDARITDLKRAVSQWGQLDLVDASFRVIDDRLVTPSSIVYLVVKARLVPPPTSTVDAVPPVSQGAIDDEKRDYEFLTGKQEAEDLPGADQNRRVAHAPRWPSSRKAGYWIVLADPKSNRVVVPPMKISDVPHADAKHPDVYRSYKLQFQAPPQVSTFTWKLYLISDTFVGEEVSQDITIDDPVLLQVEEEEEDEISDPEEDSLAGQMAMMRGGSVKKRMEGDDSDEESSTDDDEQSSGESSSSDSD